jgi:tetratricopeptide (TPR) repeat protein
MPAPTTREPNSVAQSPAEAAYARGMWAYLHGDFASAYDEFQRAIASGLTVASARFYCGMAACQLGRMHDAVPHLEAVVESEEPLPDALMEKWAPAAEVKQNVQVAVVEGVYVTMPVTSLAAALLLAELYQGLGRHDDAVDLMQELIGADPTSEPIRLSLCDLLYEGYEFEPLLLVASRADPRSTLGFACYVFKAQAEGWLGRWQDAVTTLEAALSVTEADDPKVLEAARDVLGVAYGNVGLSTTRLETFARAFSRLPTHDPAAGADVYSSPAYRDPGQIPRVPKPPGVPDRDPFTRD